MVRLIRRHPAASAIAWTALILLFLAALYVTPNYLAVLFRRL